MLLERLHSKKHVLEMSLIGMYYLPVLGGCLVPRDTEESFSLESPGIGGSSEHRFK